MRRILLLSIGLTLGVCSVAFAQSDEQAERIARGEDLFATSSFDAALAEFETVYEELATEGVAERYVLLWNIGQCYERLFQYDRALTYYRRYLDEGGAAAEDRGSVEATMRALEGLLGTIRVATNVPGAAVWVDGREVGTAPGEVRVPGGRHELELRADGHVPASQEVQLAARETVDVDVSLSLVSDYRGLSPWLFWGAAGVAAASLVAGAIVGVLALTESDRVRAWDPIFVTPADLARIDTLAITADVLYGSAALFGVTAVVLAFSTDWQGSGEAVDVAVAPWAGPGSAGVSIGGRL